MPDPILNSTSAGEVVASIKAPTPTPTPEPEAPIAASATPADPPKPAEPQVQEGTKLASQFAALSRKERQVLSKETEIKSREAAVKAFEEAKKGITEPGGVLKALDMLGVTYEQLTQAIIGKAQKPKAEEKLEEIERKLKEREDRERQAEEAAKQERVETAIAEFKADISNFVNENAEKYELIKETNSQALVYEVIDLFYSQSKEEGNPRILSLEEACTEVERHLEEQALKIAASKKVKSKLIPTEPTANNPASANSEAVKTDTTTLTNADSTSAKQVRIRRPSDAELLDEAVKQLKFV